MLLFEIVGGENNTEYQKLSVANLRRQYSFLESVVQASMAVQRPILSLGIIQALNFHAIACLHDYAGQVRPCPVSVGNGKSDDPDRYDPPAHHRVPALMDMLVNDVNRYMDGSDPVGLATYVLWRLNWIHPFVNGNGRAARAVAYYVLCIRMGSWLPGETLLPDLLRRNRDEYVAALKVADRGLREGRGADLGTLHTLVQRLLEEQLASEPPPIVQIS